MAGNVSSSCPLFSPEKIRSPAKGQLKEPSPASIDQPIGTRSWTIDGAGKMEKHPWDEKEPII